ncbi:unnamed protein product [Caenorhabditis brenneri]
MNFLEGNVVDAFVNWRTKFSRTNERILDLEKQLAETQHPGSNEAHVEATNNGDMHQEQNCRKRAREEDPNSRDEDSSCSSVDWDYSNKKAELQKRRKYMDNESTSGQNQK